jgi:ABC-type polysaccharide/polyol phosphate export permease
MGTYQALAAARPYDGAQLSGLLWTLVRTDFKTRYHGTAGGFLWALLKPVAMFLVLLGVFSFIFASDPQYKLNLIVGLFLYEFFSEGTKTGLLSLRAKAYLLTKAKFPSWIIVVTAASNAAITLALFSAVLVVFLFMTGRGPGLVTLSLFLLYQACFFLIVVGFSLGASVLFMRYRDLNQVWEVVSHAGFFVAPVIYPMDILPERTHVYLYAWPPTPIMMFSRAVLIDGSVPTALAHGLLLGETALVLLAGALVFRRHAPRVAEYL